MASQDNASDFAIWGKLNVWTLDQAAYLCCGLEPRSPNERKQNKEAIPERVRAIAQRLLTEIRPLKTAPAPVISAPRAPCGALEPKPLPSRNQPHPVSGASRSKPGRRTQGSDCRI